MKKWQLGVIIAVIILLVGGLATSMTFLFLNQKDYAAAMDNAYRKAYYDAMDSVNDIDVKLQKLTVAEGATTQTTLLNDVWLNSELAADKFGTLSTKDQPMENVIKFLNQLGDYCKYLSAKTAKAPLASSDKDTLEKLYSIVGLLKSSFDETTASVNEGESLGGKLTEGITLLGDSYEHFNNDSTVDYPEMIYDGPFSDGLSDREAKFLSDKTEISEDDAKTVVGEKFSGATDIEFITKTTDSIGSYLFNFKLNGNDCTVLITSRGGCVTQLTATAETDNPAVTENEIRASATSVAESLGYPQMEVVWSTNLNSTVYVNLAFKQNGVIFYPDLIKLKFSANDGSLIGLDATNFIYNHTPERVTPEETKTAAEALAKVSTKLTITSTRLTVIPTEWNTEIIAYEFCGTYNDGIYYVYIDADTLNEIKVMKVIDSLIV